MQETPPTSSLGYVVIDSAGLDRWRDFGTQVLGAQAVDRDGELHLRLDERPFRLLIRDAGSDAFAAAGWELRDAATFQQIEKALTDERIAFEIASAQEAHARRVGALMRLRDPAGNGIELFHTALLSASRFVSPVGVRDFVTGDLGMGHVVLPAPNLDETHDFYTRVLGFRLSDRMRPGLAEDGSGGMTLQFYHCNPRHHSLALMAAPHPAGLVHVMLEVPSVDEVGYALDRCLAHGVPLSATLGRHSNDGMLSFYMRTPGGFDVEFGCEGLLLDLDSVTTSEITSVSHWGHDFSVGFADQGGSES